MFPRPTSPRRKRLVPLAGGAGSRGRAPWAGGPAPRGAGFARPRRLGLEIEDGHLVPGLQDVPGHGTAHVPGADEADVHGGSLRGMGVAAGAQAAESSLGGPVLLAQPPRVALARPSRGLVLLAALQVRRGFERELAGLVEARQELVGGGDKGAGARRRPARAPGTWKDA